MASHQFNGIEAVPMTAARIQRQVPRLASLPTNRDRDSTPVIRAVISVAGMVWFDLLAHLDQAQPHAVVVIGRPRICKRMSYEGSRYHLLIFPIDLDGKYVGIIPKDRNLKMWT